MRTIRTISRNKSLLFLVYVCWKNIFEKNRCMSSLCTIATVRKRCPMKVNFLRCEDKFLLNCILNQ